MPYSSPMESIKPSSLVYTHIRVDVATRFTHMWRPKVNAACFPLLISFLLLETESPCDPGKLITYFIPLVNKPQGSSVSAFP